MILQSRTLLVTPSTTDLSSLFNGYDEIHSKYLPPENSKSDEKQKTDSAEFNKFGLVLIDQQWPHLNLDQLDRVLSDGMFLNVYALARE